MGPEHGSRDFRVVPVVTLLSAFEMCRVVPGLTHISNQETAAQKISLPGSGSAASQALGSKTGSNSALAILRLLPLLQWTTIFRIQSCQSQNH